MNPLATELPEDHSLWATWLDHQVVGPDLRLLVRQWELLAGINSELFPEESWEQRLVSQFSDQLPKILANGLGALSSDELLRFLRQPRLLMALQEQVFLNGGPYWERLSRSEIHVEEAYGISSKVRAAVREFDQAEGAREHRLHVSSSSEKSATLPSTKSSTKSFSRSPLRMALMLAAVAASALIAVFLMQPRDQGRYFARTGLIVSSLEGRDFTKSLAVAIREDWDTDSSDEEFRNQLRSLRDSCERLLAADLRQLSPAVAQDLKTRCKKWQASFSEMLDGLDTGRPVSEVRQEANQLVERLVTVLSDLG
jgi:hypothetical protein